MAIETEIVIKKALLVLCKAIKVDQKIDIST